MKATSKRKKMGVVWRGALWSRRNIPQRIVIVSVLIIFIVYLQGIAIAAWYINKHQHEPLDIGVTFSTSYTDYLGLDAKKTFKALRDDMGIHRFRLVTFWNDVEPQRGVYDFSNLDWQLKMIGEVDGTASISLGLRQPRWPECHMAPWAAKEPTAKRNSDVNNFIAKVVNHVKNNRHVTSYQLENEYFLGVFGDCPPSSRQQFKDEFNLVKKLDSSRPVILSLSNNYFGVPTGQPRADQFGVSVYKRVWDQTATKRYFEYPFTPTYYAYRAGLTELLTGKSSMLHELQVEPWAPNGQDLRTLPIAEQNKSMDAKRAASRIQYGIDTGFRNIDLWGGEWWYWRMVNLHDPSIWNAVKDSLDAARVKYSAH